MKFTVYNLKGSTSYKSRAVVDLKTLDELDSEAIIAQIEKYTLCHTKFRMGLMLTFERGDQITHTTLWGRKDDKEITIINRSSDFTAIYYDQLSVTARCLVTAFTMGLVIRFFPCI